LWNASPGLFLLHALQGYKTSPLSLSIARDTPLALFLLPFFTPRFFFFSASAMKSLHAFLASSIVAGASVIVSAPVRSPPIAIAAIAICRLPRSRFSSKKTQKRWRSPTILPN